MHRSPLSGCRPRMVSGRCAGGSAEVGLRFEDSRAPPGPRLRANASTWRSRLGWGSRTGGAPGVPLPEPGAPACALLNRGGAGPASGDRPSRVRTRGTPVGPDGQPLITAEASLEISEEGFGLSCTSGQGPLCAQTYRCLLTPDSSSAWSLRGAISSALNSPPGKQSAIAGGSPVNGQKPIRSRTMPSV